MTGKIKERKRMGIRKKKTGNKIEYEKKKE